MMTDAISSGVSVAVQFTRMVCVLQLVDSFTNILDIVGGVVSTTNVLF